ncbi:tetratricopeptide repeat protein, partial [Gemmatimonadota bacterium]
MSEPIAGPLRAAYDELTRRLNDGSPEGDRDAIKREIIALFKTVDQGITDLSQLKEDIRTLVEKYKQISQGESGEQAPQFTDAVPATRADHIGASTFIEKGWSLISLGDYPGAMQALEKALKLSPGDVQAESLLGWAQMLNEDYDDALNTFQQVLVREPANSLARINVGYICLKKQIFGEAIEHLSKAIRLD